MQTDVTLLPVYNKLYDLNLDEAEVEKITTKIENLEETKYSYSFLANETLVRLYPRDKYWRRDKNVELIPYDKESGKIKTGDKFINNILLKNLPCYNMEDFDKEFIFKGLDVLKLDKIDKKMLPAATILLKKDVAGTSVITSIDDIKLKIRKKYLNTFFAERYIESLMRGADVIPSELLSWAFNIEMTGVANPGQLRNSLDYIYQFTEIGEAGNIRIGLAMRKTSGFYRQSIDTAILIADCNTPAYDYMDKGRQFFASEGDVPTGDYRSSENIKKLPKLFLLNDDVNPAQVEEIFTDIANRNTSKDVVLIDSLMLETVIKRFQRRDAVAVTKEKQKDTLKTKFKKKLQKLDTPGESLNLNGITMEKNSFEYGGEKLSCDQIKISSLVESYAGYRGLDNLNFDTLSDDFFNLLTRKIERAGSTSEEWTGKIGDIDFKLENRVSKNVNGVIMRLVYMNGYRIKKDEVGDIARRALCYEDQEVFDGFCHQVSKCSLKLHKYLNVPQIGRAHV